MQFCTDSLSKCILLQFIRALDAKARVNFQKINGCSLYLDHVQDALLVRHQASHLTHNLTHKRYTLAQTLQDAHSSSITHIQVLISAGLTHNLVSHCVSEAARPHGPKLRLHIACSLLLELVLLLLLLLLLAAAIEHKLLCVLPSMLQRCFLMLMCAVFTVRARQQLHSCRLSC
jgi:hypothetical protein